MSRERRGVVNLLLEFSIPLITGVFVALIAANVAPVWYEHALDWKPFGLLSVFGNELTLHFLVNEIFMVFFFGIAAKEITEACLPGGSLNPLRKAMNPLIATAGGVIGPVVVFLGGLWLCFEFGIYSPQIDDWGVLMRGWGVPTATDIAIAWLVARTVFGNGHPAVNFLLLLAIVDDAIGLLIITVFYGDPTQPAAPIYLALVALGMAVAFALRSFGVRYWVLYVFGAGAISWSGLLLAHLHPALALVFVVPFLPAPRRDTGLFQQEDEVDQLGAEAARRMEIEHSPLHRFEHQLKPLVDVGLFFFAFANAGVTLSGIGALTWLILAALVIGKTIGVTLFGLLGVRLGFPLSDHMGLTELLMAGFVAALGLTVALFMAAAAFTDPQLQGQAKMGAVLSGFVGVVAIGLGRSLGLRRTVRRAQRS